MAGRLIGIARKDRPHAAMQVIDHARIGLNTGIDGDYRGAIKSGRNKRQVTVMTAEDWMAALDQLGQPVAWQDRRVNLLVEGIVLPRDKGAILAIGAVRLRITGECDPCRRMDAVADGLQRALRPEWRGGRTTVVVEGGEIAVGGIVEIIR